MSLIILRICVLKVSLLKWIYRKTNQYGLTSDTVLQFNVVLPVRSLLVSRWQAIIVQTVQLTLLT